ncbi:E3 ubiquitin-protein ligase Jade-2 isoform X1 [Bufo bufo]|uniref:E3 ubiquitin-protein ligase Jade-2 isoform X1 n=2 Tax=Bufo bufo TaxID=8384 RepID=UPI001ABEABFF|nr:E3 ubiquitin-protein ligase Jade-2 isoform X1 [Bufo bufo]
MTLSHCTTHLKWMLDQDQNVSPICRMEEKRRKFSVSSDDSDTTDSHATSWSRCSKTPTTKNTWTRQKEKKPSEVFRTDLITAMKVPDSFQFAPDDFYILADPWRQEWEKGVQVPAGLEAVPEPHVRLFETQEEISPSTVEDSFPEIEPPRGFRTLTKRSCRYDLDEVDTYWLEIVNTEFRKMEMPRLDELTLEKVLEELEMLCYKNMNVAIETEEGLGIEYDEDVVCDVCRSPEGEDGNEMVFCDKCNVCVHQACYGILKVPTGNWLCRSCALGVQAKCLLCPKRGGALKPTRSGTKWVHVSCALWIPEVSIGCPEKMEPITKISHIPPSRWALSCSLCKECTGTCIQCSMLSCVTAFHVTCAFDHHLEMHTTLAENDEVKFKSYCLEHSKGATKPEDQCSQRPSSSVASADADQLQQDLEKVTLRKQKLLQLEEDFHELVKSEDVAENINVNKNVVDFIYQYWKLKRKANFNKPLLSPKTDEVDDLAQQEQDVLYRRLKLFTHLRQDLERVRNLCYMITRREKMKHSMCQLDEQIFQLQMKLIEKDLCHESRKKTKGKKTSCVEKRERRGKKSVLEHPDLTSSFPIDGTFFSSWLAQPVQITTENMKMTQWSLNNGHKEHNASGLLSEELLQDEETLLSIMMDNSLKSPFEKMEAVKKVKGKIRANGKKKTRNSHCTIPQDDQLALWNDLKCFTGKAEMPSSHNHRTIRTGKASAKVQVEKKGHIDKKTLKKGSVHLPLLKTKDSKGFSDLSKVDGGEIKMKHVQPESNSPVKVPDSLGCAKSVVRVRLPKAGMESHSENSERANGLQVKEMPKGNSHLDVETDGYYSDVEMTDSEEELSQGRTPLKQFDPSSDDIVRMSILAS